MPNRARNTASSTTLFISTSKPDYTTVQVHATAVRKNYPRNLKVVFEFVVLVRTAVNFVLQYRHTGNDSSRERPSRRWQRWRFSQEQHGSCRVYAAGKHGSGTQIPDQSV